MTVQAISHTLSKMKFYLNTLMRICHWLKENGKRDWKFKKDFMEKSNLKLTTAANKTKKEQIQQSLAK